MPVATSTAIIASAVIAAGAGAATANQGRKSNRRLAEQQRANELKVRGSQKREADLAREQVSAQSRIEAGKVSQLRDQSATQKGIGTGGFGDLSESVLSDRGTA